MQNHIGTIIAIDLGVGRFLRQVVSDVQNIEQNADKAEPLWQEFAEVSRSVKHSEAVRKRYEQC